MIEVYKKKCFLEHIKYFGLSYCFDYNNAIGKIVICFTYLVFNLENVTLSILTKFLFNLYFPSIQKQINEVKEVPLEDINSARLNEVPVNHESFTEHLHSVTDEVTNISSEKLLLLVTELLFLYTFLSLLFVYLFD